MASAIAEVAIAQRTSVFAILEALGVEPTDRDADRRPLSDSRTLNTILSTSMRIARVGVGLFVLGAGACSYTTPMLECADNQDCPDGEICDLSLHVHLCVPAPAPDASPDASLACPANYSELDPSLGGHRYRSIDQGASWSDAVADCADDDTGITLHTHLVVLSNELERSRIGALNVNKAVWVGHSDRRTEGMFDAVTGEPPGYVPTSGPPWATGQPDAMTLDTDCVWLTPSAADLDDQPCDRMAPYVCECDDNVNDPSRY